MQLLLNGGGSTKELVQTMSKLNEIIDHSKPVLYVPLAMEEELIPYDSCYEWFKKQMCNIDNVNFDMIRSFEEFSNIDLLKYSAIFIGGGNTYKLMKGIKEFNIFDKINNYLDDNGIVVGCSAGSVIFGFDINCISTMDSNYVGLKDTKGFNKLNGKSIFPHYTNSKTVEKHNKYTNDLINYSSIYEDVIAIPEEDTIYIEDDKIIIIGEKPFYEFSNGVSKKIDFNDLYSINNSIRK